MQDVKASVVDYITAGVDTIGNSIIFALALIAGDPRVQRSLQGGNSIELKIIWEIF